MPCVNELVVICTASTKPESNVEVGYLLNSSLSRLLSSCRVAASWSTRHSTKLSNSHAIKDTLLVCLADLPVRTIVVGVRAEETAGGYSP